MKIINGTTRLVFVFSYFVIKFPIVEIKALFKNSTYSFSKNFKYFFKFGYKEYMERKIREKKFIAEDKQWCISNGRQWPKNYEVAGTWQNCLFNGLMSNWKEFRFHQKTKMPSTLPTFFSFLGLFNIQKRGIELTIDHDKWWSILTNLLENPDDARRAGHTLLNPKNFCQNENGKVQILDYGERRTQEFLLKHGSDIFPKIVL
ncbi:MAG: hypothetical protein WC662_02055 [Candidatus Paceibacterota bacterium]|jgi:hypothetical protein